MQKCKVATQFIVTYRDFNIEQLATVNTHVGKLSKVNYQWLLR